MKRLHRDVPGTRLRSLAPYLSSHGSFGSCPVTSRPLEFQPPLMYIAAYQATMGFCGFDTTKKQASSTMCFCKSRDRFERFWVGYALCFCRFVEAWAHFTRASRQGPLGVAEVMMGSGQSVTLCPSSFPVNSLLLGFCLRKKDTAPIRKPPHLYNGDIFCWIPRMAGNSWIP